MDDLCERRLTMGKEIKLGKILMYVVIISIVGVAGLMAL